jgi:mRNA interferase MazF
MVLCESGDVVLVSFHPPGVEGVLRRPAVVVSDHSLSEAHGLYWLCMITSAETAPRPDDVSITDPVGAGLPAASVVRAVKLATVDGSAILQRLGRLDDRDLDAVLAVVHRHRARFRSVGASFSAPPLG